MRRFFMGLLLLVIPIVTFGLDLNSTSIDWQYNQEDYSPVTGGSFYAGESLIITNQLYDTRIWRDTNNVLIVSNTLFVTTNTITANIIGILTTQELFSGSYVGGLCVVTNIVPTNTLNNYIEVSIIEGTNTFYYPRKMLKSQRSL